MFFSLSESLNLHEKYQGRFANYSHKSHLFSLCCLVFSLLEIAIIAIVNLHTNFQPTRHHNTTQIQFMGSSVINMEPSEQTRTQGAIRRAKYRELLEFGSTVTVESTAENDGAISTLKRITKIAQKSDQLNAEGRFQDRVENTTEVGMDAQVMKMTHELLGSVVQTMDNAEISEDEYVAAINRLIGPNKDWEKLAEIGMKIAKTFYYSQPLFGTFDEETVMPQKELKERQKSKSKNTEQMKPVAVSEQEKENQVAGETNLAMSQLSKLFKENKNEPLPYFKVIIDPTNFMKTVQNAFQMSFLFRDGILTIGKDKFGYPTIRPTSESDKKTIDESTQQMVSTLTTKLCDEMIQRYNITEAYLSWDHS